MAFDGGRPQEPARRTPPIDIGGAIILGSIIIAVPWIGIPLLAICAIVGAKKK